MSFPSEGHDTTYAFNLKDVVRMLKTKHGDNYLVSTQRRFPLARPPMFVYCVLLSGE